MGGYSSGYWHLMIPSSLSRENRLNMFLMSKKTAALVGARLRDYRSLIYISVASCMELITKYMPPLPSAAQL